jgi:acetylornithine aminotransferase
MMIAIDLAEPCPDLVKLALENGLLINVTAGNTIRLLPPLIINKEQIQEIIEKMSKLIIQFVEKS